MDISLTPDELAFRDEVRSFLDANLTDDLRRAGRLMTSVFADFEAAMAWQKILHEKKGWAAPHWPKKFGGTDWTVMQHYIYSEECAKAEAPTLLPMGLAMLGPLLCGKGTAEQQAYYLPRMLTGEDFWCQGYSEPGSGSDLASLACKAERDGDHYVINGSKIWTTYAHHANRMFCLVRTDNSGKPQQGITFLLLDMNTPGITVDPIWSFTEEHEQNQVFFEDVRVPVGNVVGRENDGWTVAKYLLEFERGGNAYGPRMRVGLGKIKRIASRESSSLGGRLIDDPAFRQKLAAAEIELLAVEFSEHRVMAALSHGQNPGAVSSMLKIRGTEMSQKLSELAVEALGWHALPFQADALDPHRHVPDIVGHPDGVPAASFYFNTRAASIYGGSNEIQRNIIAKLVLGL
ncbi:MAG: acyl-CoA dehydrogenase family protein [Pseudomonadota bacterium]